jgi:hypothetical protein
MRFIGVHFFYGALEFGLVDGPIQETHSKVVHTKRGIFVSDFLNALVE